MECMVETELLVFTLEGRDREVTEAVVSKATRSCKCARCREASGRARRRDESREMEGTSSKSKGQEYAREELRNDTAARACAREWALAWKERRRRGKIREFGQGGAPNEGTASSRGRN